VEAQSSVQLSGPVKTAAQPNFTILSINVGTTTTTMFGALRGAWTALLERDVGVVGRGTGKLSRALDGHLKVCGAGINAGPAIRSA
jgi:hypothetical protein